MKLYLIRHGQSEGNLQKRHSGWQPFALTEQGRAEAAYVGTLLRDIPFDKIYSSDLKRAVETQQLALPDAEVERSPLLREINVGNLGGRPFEECLAEFGESYAAARRGFEFSPYGGESYEEFRSRICEFLTLMEQSEYQSVACFCHGGLINTMLDVISGHRLYRPNFRCQNCSISVFEYQDGRWRVNLWNYTGMIG